MQPRRDVFFNLLKACFDGLSFYPAGNPIVSQQMTNLIELCHSLMDGDRLVLSLGLHHYALAGEPLPQKVLTLPSVTWLTSVFAARQLHTMILHHGLSLRDIEHLMRLLQLEPNRFLHAASANELLEHHKVWRIQFNSVVTVSDQPFAALDVSQTFASWNPTSVPQTLSRGLMAELAGTPMAEPLPPPLAPGLLIDPIQQKTLAHAMSTAIKGRNLKRVAETLTLIRSDLRAIDRDDRELAFSSYQVVVDCLIEANEDSSLLTILKSMGADLQNCRETDLYAIHLATVFKILSHFEAINHHLGVAYALNLFAHQNLCQEEERRQLVSRDLDRILDLQLFERLIAQPTQELGPVLQALFQRHGLGILKQLLNALYEAQNRTTRKKLLDLLANLGTLSYPILLEELRGALREHRPWYIKRNLLTLLSMSPPPDLVEVLPELYQEGHPKLQELVIRCLFQIPTPDAYKLGRTLIREGNPAQVQRILRILQASRHGAYAFELMELFKRTEDNGLRQELILTLGKMGSPESERFLIEILDKTPATSVKITTPQRLAAIGMLATSTRPAARDALLRHRRDFSPEIRQAVQTALDRDSVSNQTD